MTPVEITLVVIAIMLLCSHFFMEAMYNHPNIDVDESTLRSVQLSASGVSTLLMFILMAFVLLRFHGESRRINKFMSDHGMAASVPGSAS